MSHKFEDVEVKNNAIALLELSLKSKCKKTMIGTGCMSDLYMPIEPQLQYVRKALELIEKYGFGFSVITKSKLILRNLDLLVKINKKTKCVIQMTLITFNDDLYKIIESNIATTKERFEVLMRFREKIFLQ